MDGLTAGPVPQAYEPRMCVEWIHKCVYMFVFVWVCAHRPENVAAGLTHYGPSFCPFGLDYPAVCRFYSFEIRSAVRIGLGLPYTAEDDFELLILLHTPSECWDMGMHHHTWLM